MDKNESIDQWQVIGVYVGERRNDTITLAVGYVGRADALTDQWPLLFENDPARLAELCVLT